MHINERYRNLAIYFKRHNKLNSAVKMFVVTCLTLLIVTLVLYLSNFLKNYILQVKAVKKLPGPVRRPIIGNWEHLIDSHENIFKKVRSWGKEFPYYYAIVTYPVVVVNLVGPEDIEKLISSSKHSSKSFAYSYLNAWLGDGLLLSNKSKWLQRRKQLTPAFHFSILQDFIEVFQRETERLVKQLQKIAGQDNVNIVPYITEFALYSIIETSMGVSLHGLEKEKDDYIKTVLAMGEAISYRITRPWLLFNYFYYHFTLSGFKELKHTKKLHAFTNNIIQKKIESRNLKNFKETKRLAMLDLLLNATMKDGSIDLDGIKEEINTFLFEGHDTTKTALSFALMELAQHPDIQTRILQEINEVFLPSEAMSYQKLNELSYMERCLKECMRLHPSVPFMSRVTDEEIITSQNEIIPKGIMVNVHVYDLHRNSRIYPNPEKFDPDRFLPENIKKRHPFAYLPFSAGPRNCIGQRFALLELKTALVGILRNFILEAVDTNETITLTLDFVLRSVNGIKVKLVKRALIN